MGEIVITMLDVRNYYHHEQLMITSGVNISIICPNAYRRTEGKKKNFRSKQKMKSEKTFFLSWCQKQWRQNMSGSIIVCLFTSFWTNNSYPPKINDMQKMVNISLLIIWRTSRCCFSKDIVEMFIKWFRKKL